MKIFSSKHKPFGWVKKHKIYSFLIALIVFAGGIFGYNKYLDWQNVKDMKALLSAFEQLEKDVEESTGEDLTIEADCGSVGKFATSYACSMYLKNSRDLVLSYSKYTGRESVLNNENNQCRVIDGQDALYIGFYACSFSVRLSNKNTAESIFYQYDTSPGRAF